MRDEASANPNHSPSRVADRHVRITVEWSLFITSEIMGYNEKYQSHLIALMKM